jgi:MFS family permease
MSLFPPSQQISHEELEKGLSFTIFEGISTHALLTLTAGIFLVAFALQLGASNTVIGIIAAIPAIAELFQIFAVPLIQKIRNRRLIAVVTTFLSRICWIGIAFIPILFPSAFSIGILVVLLAVYSVISAVKHCTWKSWMRDLIPQQIFGNYFSRRMSISLGIGIILSLLAAFFVDTWTLQSGNLPVYAYSILFLTGALIGLFGVYFLAKTPEPLIQPAPQVPLKTLIVQSFADPNFKNLIIFLAFWNFAINLAAPFFTVYFLQRLHLDLVWIIVLSIISQVFSMLSYPWWGALSDRSGNKVVLRISGPLFMFCVLGLTFTSLPDPHLFTLPLLILLHIVMGISLAGSTLAIGNIGLKLAPRGAATSYLALISIVSALSAGIAPVIGGLSVDYLADCEVIWNLTIRFHEQLLTIPTLHLIHWDFFFVLSFFIGLFAVYRLRFVREEGEICEKVSVRALLSQVNRDMRNFSTAGGLRNLLRFPMTPQQPDADRKQENEHS